MKRFAPRFVSLAVTLTLISAGAFFAEDAARAQTRGKTTPAAPPPAKGRSAGDGQERLLIERDWNKDTGELKQFQELRKGATTANMNEVLDHAAQWYAYRLTHAEYQDPNPKPPFKPVHDIVKEAQDQILDVRDPKKQLTAGQRSFMDEFGKRLAGCLREVSKNPKVIARVNAAMLLARLAAATGQDGAIEGLVEIIQDPNENDGVKLYAFRGLREFFGSGRGESPFTDKEKEGRVIRALLDYLTRKSALGDGAAPEEVAAVNYVRAEAVAALGQTRYPAASRVVMKTTHIERPTALVLLRYLRKDGIQPEPSLPEQVAAAVGLCQLHSKELDQYNADYAAYHLGRFLVDFVSAYNNAKAQPDKKEAWKIYAHRLSNALGTLEADLANPPANEHTSYVSKLAERANRLLSQIVSSNMANPQPNELSGWLDQNPPKSKMVYKGVADAVVNEGDKAAGG